LVASDPEGPDALTDGSTRPPRCPRRHAQIRRAGLVQGSSRGERSAGTRNRPYGVPRIWLMVALSGTSGCPDSSVLRGMRPVTDGKRVVLRITHWRSGSKAALRQFVPPITPGYWTFHARGGKDAVVAIALDEFPALTLVPGREAPGVIAAERR
jgi:hypothetical protein